MLQLSCRTVAPPISDAVVETGIREATYGHLSYVSVGWSPVAALVSLTIASVIRIHTGMTAALMSINQPEVKRP